MGRLRRHGGRQSQGSDERGARLRAATDPRLVEDFTAPRLAIDVTSYHVYAVTWGLRGAEFSIDNVIIHRSTTATSYPMQVMIGVFDFPSWRAGDEHLTPEMCIDWVSDGVSEPPLLFTRTCVE